MSDQPPARVERDGPLAEIVAAVRAGGMAEADRRTPGQAKFEGR